MSDGARNRQTRELAERAFASLLDEVGDRWQELVLIGGLVPQTLVVGGDAHQGTLDVDVLLPLGLIYDRDDAEFGWLERALHRAGFAPLAPNTGWRWIVDVEGSPVVVEFLVDVPDNLDQQLALPGATQLAAQNLAGPGPALRDTEHRIIDGRSARVAGVGGFIAAKASAIHRRAKTKDLYDFAYVIVHRLAAEGPALVNRIIAATAPSPALQRDLLRDVLDACNRYDTADSDGSRAYAAGSRDAGVPREAAALAEEARRSVSALKEMLLRQAIQP